MLRDYQQRSLDQLYQWFGKNYDGNPCLVLPTGSGKSHIIAAFVKDALQQWPETRILMLTAQKELIEQNAQKLKEHWHYAPVGICSASLGSRTLHMPITFAGIQSIHRYARDVGHVDIVVVDECDMINNTEAGIYRRFLGELKAINPHLRVVGLTATPYRLGQGMITDGKDALFSDLIEPVTIEELVHRGFLAPLSSKHTDTVLDVSDVGKSGGDYIAGQLERALDVDAVTDAIVAESLERASDRKSFLWFCAGVSHSEHTAEALRRRGESAHAITGKTPKGERARLIEAFRSGDIKHLTNANVLTVGFDAPNTDCLVMMRPTLSPRLYVQMAGRGMRLKTNGAKDCKVLDFAGNVSTHGPITCVVPPSKKGKSKGEAPTKTCPVCREIVAASARVCPCGHEFPPPKKEEAARFLHNDDIMGIAPLEMAVESWQWRKHHSFSSGKDCLRVTYYYGITHAVTEYFVVNNEGQSGAVARSTVAHIASRCGVTLADTLEGTAQALSEASPPKHIKYKRDGKYDRVLHREW